MPTNNNTTAGMLQLQPFFDDISYYKSISVVNIVHVADDGEVIYNARIADPNVEPWFLISMKMKHTITILKTHKQVVTRNGVDYYNISGCWCGYITKHSVLFSYSVQHVVQEAIRDYVNKITKGGSHAVHKSGSENEV